MSDGRHQYLTDSRNKRERWLVCRSFLFGAGWLGFTQSFWWGFRVGFVVVLAVCWARAWWQYRQERQQDMQPPEGMVSVTLNTGRKVFAPPTTELLAAVDHLVNLVERAQ